MAEKFLKDSGNLLKYNGNILKHYVAEGGGGKSFNDIINDGHTVGWWDYLDEASFVYDSEETTRIIEWKEHLAGNISFIQATALQGPTLGATGVEFTVSGQEYLYTSDLGGLTTPMTVYMYVNPQSTNPFFMCGQYAYTIGIINDQYNVYTDFAIPTTLKSNDLYGWHVWKFAYDGNNSNFEIDETIQYKGINPGTSNTFGSETDLGANPYAFFADITIKHLIIRDIADTHDDMAVVEAYLRSIEPA